MKRIKLFFNIAIGIFIGLTFPEQLNELIAFLKAFDYAGLFESIKMFGMKAFELGKSGVEAIMGLFEKSAEMSQ